MLQIKTMVSFLAVAICGSSAMAVSPVSVQQGQQLFVRHWEQRNSMIASDGLGPLFNGSSCVTCHHQGGVGGGGDAEFNSQTVGIEKIRITGDLWMTA